MFKNILVFVLFVLFGFMLSFLVVYTFDVESERYFSNEGFTNAL